MAVAISRTDPARFLPACLSGTLRRPGEKPKAMSFLALADGRWVSAVILTARKACTVRLLYGDGTATTSREVALSVS